MTIKRNDKYEGWVVSGNLINGSTVIAFETREEAIKYLEGWLGQRFDEPLLVNEIVKVECDYFTLIYTDYYKCSVCGYPILCSEDYSYYNGMCADCYDDSTNDCDDDIDLDDFTEVKLSDAVAAFDHTAHKELWNWLAHNPGKKKHQWPGWRGNGGNYSITTRCECFACEYASNVEDEDSDEGICTLCPLEWGTDDCYGSCGLFRLWEQAREPQERRELAYKIRDLKVREGVKTI